MNFVALDGHLLKDPEQRGGDKGPVVMRVAVENRRKNKQTGEWDVFYDNFDVTVWGQRRPQALSYKEGDKVMLSGRLKRDSYEKDGQKVYQTLVNVESLAGVANGSTETAQASTTTGDDFEF